MLSSVFPASSTRIQCIPGGKVLQSSLTISHVMQINCKHKSSADIVGEVLILLS